MHIFNKEDDMINQSPAYYRALIEKILETDNDDWPPELDEQELLWYDVALNVKKGLAPSFVLHWLGSKLPMFSESVNINIDTNYTIMNWLYSMHEPNLFHMIIKNPKANKTASNDTINPTTIVDLIQPLLVQRFGQEIHDMALKKMESDVSIPGRIELEFESILIGKLVNKYYRELHIKDIKRPMPVSARSGLT